MLGGALLYISRAHNWLLHGPVVRRLEITVRIITCWSISFSFNLTRQILLITRHSVYVEWSQLYEREQNRLEKITSKIYPRRLIFVT